MEVYFAAGDEYFVYYDHWKVHDLKKTHEMKETDKVLKAELVDHIIKPYNSDYNFICYVYKHPVIEEWRVVIAGGSHPNWSDEHILAPELIGIYDVNKGFVEILLLRGIFDGMTVEDTLRVVKGMLGDDGE